MEIIGKYIKISALLLLLGDSGVWSLKTTDTPEMKELLHFKRKKGEAVNLFQKIAPQYKDFGICLLNDTDGNKVSAIDIDHNKVADKIRTIFFEWRKGSGKRPETWATVIQCLREVGLNNPADIIVEECEDMDIDKENLSHSSDIEQSNKDNEYECPSEQRNFEHLDSLASSAGLDMNFVCVKDDILECVTQNPTARGLAIIITNDYLNTRMSQLPGTKKDGRSLLETLVHAKFIVVWLHNVNKCAVLNVIKEVKEQASGDGCGTIQKYECILFAFSGHGTNNKYIIMQDGQLDIDEYILQPLLPHSIPEFGEVPKVILSDACRGNSTTSVFFANVKSPMDAFTKDSVPAEGNYLLACATMPEHYAYMYENGSAWMQEVASQLRTSTESITDVLVDVNTKLVEQANKNLIRFQQPDTYYTLTKKVHIYKPDSDRTQREDL